MNSDQVKSGVERAPHRSLLKADGYSDEQIRLVAAYFAAQPAAK